MLPFRTGILPLTFSISSKIAACFARNFCVPPKTQIGGSSKDGLILKFRGDCVRISNLDDALTLFDQFLLERPIPSVIVFTQILSFIVKLRHYHAAISLSRQLQDKGILSLYTLTININCYCRLNQVDLGFSVLGKIIKLGYQPDIVIFNTLIDGLCKTINMLMRLSVVTYGTLINGLCKLGRYVDALKVLRKIGLTGCEPDVAMYNSIIDSLCKDGLLSQALELRDTMIIKGIVPNIVTFNTLLWGLCSSRRWDDIERLLREMFDKNIFPNDRTFNTLVDSFCKEGMLREAENVMKLMIEGGFDPNVVTYSTLIDGFCMQGRMDEALQIFNSIVAKGCVPNIVTYNSLLNGFCKQRRMDDAVGLFREMSQKGLSLNAHTYNTILDGLCKAGGLEDAQNLFDEIQSRRGAVDEVTYATLLDALCKSQHLEKAVELLHRMQDRGIVPDIVTYNILIMAIIEFAQKLLSFLETKRQVDVTTYNIVIQRLCKGGKLNEAEDLMVRMEGNGYSPNDITYNLMIQAFLRKHEIPKALQYIQMIRDKGYSAFNNTLSLIVGLLSSNKLDPSSKQMLENFIVKMGHWPTAISLSRHLELGPKRIPCGIYTLNTDINFMLMLVSLLGKIIKLGYQPGIVSLSPYNTLINDATTYGTLTNGLCKLGCHVQPLQSMQEWAVVSGLKLFNIMISKSVPPDVVTFNTFFWGLCNSRQWDDVKRVLLEMFDKNICPNDFTFTTLVDSFC
ncbi:hypothetical protein Cgig2_018856 [Carnegiea gigantea]|uniref:Uncharacterized protein n=1 Tax=Carnegiea gigantea TaxID=171969 RepID=A0A9Q1GSS0_9CARY|nr:hypothetical protein Cgig2_018856 [Carnegiea gigantea]